MTVSLQTCSPYCNLLETSRSPEVARSNLAAISEHIDHSYFAGLLQHLSQDLARQQGPSLNPKNPGAPQKSNPNTSLPTPPDSLRVTQRNGIAEASNIEVYAAASTPGSSPRTFSVRTRTGKIQPSYAFQRRTGNEPSRLGRNASDVWKFCGSR